MGYTHYWSTHRSFTQKEWASLIGITSLLLQKAPGKTATAGGYHKDDPLEIQRDWDDERPPEVTKERIWFNGAGDLGHETFTLLQNEIGDSWCKTARKPYDLLVCAVLLAAHEIAPEAITLFTDGEVEDWEPAAEFFEKVTGLSMKLEEIFPSKLLRRRTEMTKKNQRKILRDLMKSIRSRLLAHSDQWPEEWDGHEIRELLFMAAAWERSHLMTSLSNSKTERKREFDNEWAVRDLY